MKNLAKGINKKFNNDPTKNSVKTFKTSQTKCFIAPEDAKIIFSKESKHDIMLKNRLRMFSQNIKRLQSQDQSLDPSPRSPKKLPIVNEIQFDLKKCDNQVQDLKP